MWNVENDDKSMIKGKNKGAKQAGTVEGVEGREGFANTREVTWKKCDTLLWARMYKMVTLRAIAEFRGVKEVRNMYTEDKRKKMKRVSS